VPPVLIQSLKSLSPLSPLNGNRTTVAGICACVRKPRTRNAPSMPGLSQSYRIVTVLPDSCAVHSGFQQFEPPLVQPTSGTPSEQASKASHSPSHSTIVGASTSPHKINCAFAPSVCSHVCSLASRTCQPPPGRANPTPESTTRP